MSLEHFFAEGMIPSTLLDHRERILFLAMRAGEIDQNLQGHLFHFLQCWLRGHLFS